LRWDLLAAGSGIVFCFTITWTLFTAVVLRWTESAILAFAALASGWAYYACWLRSHTLSSSSEEGRPAVPSPADPVAASEVGVIS
jgi:hypothetical protein